MSLRRHDIDYRPPVAVDEPEGFDELPEWLQDEARERWANQHGVVVDAESRRKRRTQLACIAAALMAGVLSTGVSSSVATIVAVIASSGITFLLRQREAGALSYGCAFLLATGVPCALALLGRLELGFGSIGFIFLFLMIGAAGFVLGLFAQPEDL